MGSADRGAEAVPKLPNAGLEGGPEMKIDLQPITCATQDCDLPPTLWCPDCGLNWCEMCIYDAGNRCPGCEGTA